MAWARPTFAFRVMMPQSIPYALTRIPALLVIDGAVVVLSS